MSTAATGRRSGWWVGIALAGIAVAGCSDSGDELTRPRGSDFGDLTCSIPSSQIFNGGPGRDGIPALTDPELVRADADAAAYLRHDDRVIGLALEGEVLAIPLNILWWHEIVNLRVGDLDLAVTHCPLTGSSLAFDRAAVEGAELGVSGLLYMNNLLMYDRTTNESLWPQMLAEARCGPSDGTQLGMVPIIELTWKGWRELHPASRVVSGNSGFNRDYTVYPYGRYDEPDNEQLLFPIPNFDTTRPPKERVLVLPAESPAGPAGVGLPFGMLSDLGRLAAVRVLDDGIDAIVFWDARRDAAMAYRPMLDGEALTFSVNEEGIVDGATGSVWRLDGLAVEGELAGRRLEPVADAFIAFWFAWRAFYPEGELWTAS